MHLHRQNSSLSLALIDWHWHYPIGVSIFTSQIFPISISSFLQITWSPWRRHIYFIIGKFHIGLGTFSFVIGTLSPALAFLTLSNKSSSAFPNFVKIASSPHFWHIDFDIGIGKIPLHHWHSLAGIGIPSFGIGTFTL
jgi:hypothetical protein